MPGPTPPAFECRFEFTPDGTAVVVALVGKLDPAAVEELHPQVQEMYRAGLRRFVFDLRRLDHAGSLGLRLLVGLHNQVKGQGRVALCAPSDAVRSILKMSKLTDILPEYQSREAALAALTE
jgi:anti-anti-sigma factor